MEENISNGHKQIGYDLPEMALAFGIKKQKKCKHLEEWLAAKYELTATENELLQDLFAETEEDAEYWNEEEMKMKGVALMFYLSKVEVPQKIKVFYERRLKGQVGDFDLSVVSDCMVATPMEFNAPQKPYFFLQEFKKAKGDKNDPEGQMLQAMLIAQEQNADGKPIYGGFLIGSKWTFTTLIGRDYCPSRSFYTNELDDLRQIIFILRKLKDLILNR